MPMPLNRTVLDPKPLNRQLDQVHGTEQLYSRTLGALTPIGLTLLFLYLTPIVVISSRT